MYSRCSHHSCSLTLNRCHLCFETVDACRLASVLTCRHRSVGLLLFGQARATCLPWYAVASGRCMPCHAMLTFDRSFGYPFAVTCRQRASAGCAYSNEGLLARETSINRRRSPGRCRGERSRGKCLVRQEAGVRGHVGSLGLVRCDGSSQPHAAAGSGECSHWARLFRCM